MDVFKTLDEFEEFLLNCSRIPFTNTLMVDEEKVLDFLDQLRHCLPEEIVSAESLLKKKETILSEAKREAQLIIDDAKEYTSKLADESAIMKQAYAQADEIIQHAKRTARDIRIGADSYADDVLGGLEESLKKLLETVVNNRKELRELKEAK